MRGLVPDAGAGDAQAVSRPPLATSPFARRDIAAPTVAGIDVGDRITVDRYGMGRVLRVCPDQELVVVDFGGGVIRQVPASARGFCRL